MKIEGIDDKEDSEFSRLLILCDIKAILSDDPVYTSAKGIYVYKFSLENVIFTDLKEPRTFTYSKCL